MLEAHNITHSYGDTDVLHDIDMQVAEGDIYCLLGPSGCGKTTLLRIIAGLEPGYGGTVTVAGEDMRGIDVHTRGFGLMFQDFALFPHMTVHENVAFGLQMQGASRKQQTKRVDEMLEVVGLESYGERDVTQLSGGEKQRVALARSLAPEPRLLMLDEPLGSLDANLRERLMVDVRRIIKAVGLTAVYVTHDQQEAYAVADQIAVMQAGRIVQADTPERLYRQPKTPFIAQFLGLNNVVSPQHLPDTYQPERSAEAVLLHPAGITLTTERDAVLTGTVIERIFRGNRYRLQVKLNDDVTLQFTVPFNHTPPADGETAYLALDAEAIVPLHDEPT